MLKIYKYPFISRDEIAKKLLRCSLPVFLLLLLSMVPLFKFMAADSDKNRDAITKITSQETELSLLLVFAVFLFSIVYISVVGIRLSNQTRRSLEIWVSFRGSVYYIKANSPRGTIASSPQRFNSVISSQDSAMCFLGDEGKIRELLTSGQTPCGITLLCAEGAKISKKKDHSVIYFENGRKVKLYKDIIDYDTLIESFL